ncbi:helix-turn-helix transcriptional regulator [Bacteroidia bacterium]|nr:helix-turn-helix transcriptional regulator [Bacteroidia bacterium]
MRTFILADNQFITRQGVRSLVEKEILTDTLVEVATSEELKVQLSLYPDAVVVLDYTLFDLSDYQLLNLRQRYSLSLWLLFSDELSKPFLRRTLQSGHNPFGVVMKDATRNEMLTALKLAARGEVYLCEPAKEVLREEVPVSNISDKLTVAERQILQEIAIGKTTREIATERSLSFHTINTHRKNIFRKLEVNNVHEATKYAIRAGIIDIAEYSI